MNGLLLVFTLLLVALNAFFVIAEYSLVRSSPAKLEMAREEILRGAALALSQVEQINDYISTCQIGVTMASIGIGAIGTLALARILESLFPPGVSHGVAVAIAAVISYLAITSVQIVAGEIVPKLYAIDRAKVAGAAAVVTRARRSAPRARSRRR